MATKPPTSKTTKRSSSPGEEPAAPSAEKTTKKATVSLIDEAGAKKKRTGELKTGSSFTPLGAKGVGESGLGGALGALCGAVEDAFPDLDVRIDELPLTPRRVWWAIRKAASGSGGARG